MTNGQDARKTLIPSRSGLEYLVRFADICNRKQFCMNFNGIIVGFAFCCLWGIHEMFLQEKRVLRGWFPENPKRHAYYEARRKELGING